MTDYIKLNKDDFVSCHGGSTKSMEPTVVVKDSGLFILNRSAMGILGGVVGVSFCEEKSSRNCFAIMGDKEGFLLHATSCGRMMFNNVKLARHIISCTVMRMSLPAGAVVPKKVLFHVARVSVDDDKNKGVFALILKK